MQHIFNIAIDMDDKRIVNAVCERAESEILKKLEHDVEDTLFSHRGGWSSDRWNPNKRDGLSDILQDKFDEFLNKNRDDIIDRAEKYLAERLARSKKGRELLSDLEKES